MSRPFGYALNPKGLEIQFPGGDDAEWNEDHASAIETFVTEHGDELFEIVRAALEQWVSEMEDDAKAAADKRVERDKEKNAEAMRVYYGEEEEEVAVDEEVVGLFDDPEDVFEDDLVEEELEDEEPFYTRYTLQTVYVHGPDQFGLAGTCDWDPEHGVGVRMKGLEVIELGHVSDAFS